MQNSKRFMNDQIPTFEDFKHENGMTYWWASDFMRMLGYETMTSFKKVIDKATKAFISLNISHHEQIIFYKRNEGGSEYNDYKLTRFACYIIAMNGDSSKKEVASAQAFFAQKTQEFQLYLQGSNDMERLIYREEVKAGQKSLMSTARQAGVITSQDFAMFNNKGYLGLYNQSLWDLKEKRGIPKQSNVHVQDYMGRAELAANLFRITQTEEKIKRDRVRTANEANETHFEVGRQIRDLVIKNTGKYPEELPVERRLPDVKRELKKGMKLLQSIDKKKPKSKSKK